VLLVFERYTFDESNRELRRGSELVRIDPQQLDLLHLFLRHPGELLSRQQIIDCIWEGRIIADSVLSVSIAKLRKVLGKTQEGRDYIESRYGRGYRFLYEVKQRQQEQPVQVPYTLEDAPAHGSLVGRTSAFEQLRSAADEAQQGRGRLCLLTGEAGIGKTRLAECLDQLVQEHGSALAVWGRCQSDERTPLWPVRQIIRELAKHGLADDALVNLNKAGVLPSDHSLLDALAQCVLEASRRRPLLLIVDDIQWADSATLRMLTYLTDEIVRAPILLVCGLRYRGAAMSGSAAAHKEVSRLWNHRNCERIELQRLQARDVADYVQARFGHADHDAVELAQLSRSLFTRSEGNPFFMVDLLHALDPRELRLAPALRPSSLALDSVRERLQDLSASTRGVLCAAAVVGHDFDLGLLSHVAQRKIEDVLEALTDPLVQQNVVAANGALGAFVFEHELIRELLYVELTPLERGQLHLRAGQGLLSRRSNGGDVTHAELAHHFLAAQPYGDLEVAIAYAQTAAAEASRTAAHSDVRELLQRALDVLRFRVAPRPELRAALLLQLAMVERVLGDPAHDAHLAAAVSIAREHRLARLLTIANPLLGVPSVATIPDTIDGEEAAYSSDNGYESLEIMRAHLA
jgi:DNA-binding winged helix-turn-helix (wHTH) protein